jgi:hypothetical protein
MGAVPRGLACASANVAGVKFITQTPRELPSPASLEISKVCGTKWILGVILGRMAPVKC